MLVVNYIEVQFDMAAVYLFVSNFIYNKMHTVQHAMGFIIGNPERIKEYQWLQFANNGIKFFFLTVALDTGELIRNQSKKDAKNGYYEGKEIRKLFFK